jgi:CNT family concentrative nucleoside transporter
MGGGGSREVEAGAGVPAWKFRLAIGAGVLALVGTNALVTSLGGGWLRLGSLLGLVFIFGLALLMSEDLRRLPWRTILVGLSLQLALALVVLKTPAGVVFFGFVGAAFTAVRGAASWAGGQVLGGLTGVGFALAIEIATVIIVVGTLSRILYHVGAMQVFVRWAAWLMRRLMRASGAESIATAANIFVGMVEAPLMVRPYVAGMTRSELFTVMTAGMATIAGSVMVLYQKLVAPLLGEAAAGHLLTASVLSAPAAIVVAKIMIPETGTPATLDADVTPDLDEGEGRPMNVMDAAARGASEGLALALSVVGVLIAFYALVWLANEALRGASLLVCPGHVVSLQEIMGYACSPVAVGMGVPLDEAVRAGQLIGEKTVLNEFVAYDHLGKAVAADRSWLSPHAGLVMSYALCGFANFGSVAIMIAGVGGIAPGQRGNLTKLGIRSIAAGSLAAFMTGCVAGLLA